MENEFVSRIHAEDLKMLGFNENCISHFRGECIEPCPQLYHNFKYVTNSYFSDDTNYFLARPTYETVFKWFRDNYDLYTEFRIEESKIDKNIYYSLNILQIQNNKKILSNLGRGELYEMKYNALSFLIDLIKIIK